MNTERTTDVTHFKAKTVRRALELALAELASVPGDTLIANPGAIAVQAYDDLYIDVKVTSFPVVREVL